MATPSLFEVNQIANEPNFFKKAIKDNLKLLVISEFIINFYTFNILLELILVPILAFLIIMLVVAQSDTKFEPVRKLLNFIFALIGFGLLFYASYKLKTDWQAFFNRNTLQDFIIPPILTLLYIPFLWFISIYIDYQSLYSRLPIFIKDSSIRSYAKRKALLTFHIRTMLLKRWGQNLITLNIQNKQDVDNSVDGVFNIWSREKSHEEVQYHNGWSPFAASSYLKTEGLETDHYRYNSNSDEWFSNSQYVKIDEGILANNISYYIDGNETVVTKLILLLNVNKPDQSQETLQKFLNSAQILFEKALNQQMPKQIEEDILSEREISTYLVSRKIKLERNLLQDDKLGGYVLKLTIETEEQEK